jgi:hypothetical protein
MWHDTRPQLKTTHSAACIKPTTARTAAFRYFGCENCAFQTSKTTLARPILYLSRTRPVASAAAAPASLERSIEI